MYQFLDSAKFTAPEVQRKRSGSITDNSNANAEILKCFYSPSSMPRTPKSNPRTPIQSSNRSPGGKNDIAELRRPSQSALSGRAIPPITSPMDRRSAESSPIKSRSTSINSDIGDNGVKKASKSLFATLIDNKMASPIKEASNRSFDPIDVQPPSISSPKTLVECDKSSANQSSPIRTFVPKSASTVLNSSAYSPIRRFSTIIDNHQKGIISLDASPKTQNIVVENSSPGIRRMESRRSSVQSIVIISPENEKTFVENGSPVRAKSQKTQELNDFHSIIVGGAAKVENHLSTLKPYILFDNVAGSEKKEDGDEIHSNSVSNDAIHIENSAKTRSNSILGVPRIFRQESLNDEQQKFVVSSPSRFIDLGESVQSNSGIDLHNPWNVDSTKLSSYKKSVSSPIRTAENDTFKGNSSIYDLAASLAETDLSNRF